MRPEVRVLYHPPRFAVDDHRRRRVLAARLREVALDRARELIKPYTVRQDVLGVYLLGSSSRPYRDHLSDYDFEVVIADEAYPKIPREELLVFTMNEGPPRRVDHEFYLRPLSELERHVDSPHDVFHGSYRHAIVLHDPQGILRPLIERLAELPEHVREARIRVHYLEVYEGIARGRKTLQRASQSQGNVQLLLGEARRALVKLQFLQMRLWPMPWHWAKEELDLAGACDEPRVALDSAIDGPSAETLRGALDTLNAWLTSAGETFHEDVRALFDWLYLTPEGKAAHHRWAAR